MSHFLRYAGLFVTVGTAIILSACSGSRPAFLGTEQTALTLCPSSPNCVSSTENEDADHKIEAISYSNEEAARSKLLDVISSNPRAEIIVSSNAYIYAEYTSSIMRYVDDVEFLFDNKNRQIDVRSASRLGYSDLGVNRKRIEDIRSQMQEKP